MEQECTYQVLAIEDIQLDRENPRIKQFLEMYGDDLAPEQIHLALNVGSAEGDSSATTFQSLEQSIHTHGSIIHPILVNRQVGGELRVVEGNTRLAIYQRFLEKGYDGKWDTIPAMVYENLDQAEVDAIRLQSHLVGPRPWDPYSKAKYLHHLRNTEHLPMAQVVDYCGGRQREVQTYLGAYEDMEKYYRTKLEAGEPFDPSRFSAFVELQRPNVQIAILNAGCDRYDFAEWVIKLLIYPLNTVRKLPQILADKRAKEVFLKDGAREAIRLLDAPVADDALKDAPLEALALAISRRIRLMQLPELKQLREEREGFEVPILMEALDELAFLCKQIARDE